MIQRWSRSGPFLAWMSELLRTADERRKQRCNTSRGQCCGFHDALLSMWSYVVRPVLQEKIRS